MFSIVLNSTQGNVGLKRQIHFMKKQRKRDNAISEVIPGMEGGFSKTTSYYLSIRMLVTNSF